MSITDIDTGLDVQRYPHYARYDLTFDNSGGGSDVTFTAGELVKVAADGTISVMQSGDWTAATDVALVEITGTVAAGQSGAVTCGFGWRIGYGTIGNSGKPATANIAFVVGAQKLGNTIEI